jgi:hypothetical protein
VRAPVAARTGLFVGLACLLPVGLWIAPQLLDSSPNPRALHAGLGRALAGLWLAQALAIAALAPRVVASSWAEGAAGLLTLIAIPLPLISAIWLAGAAGAFSLLAGVALLAAVAGGVLALGKGLENAPWGEPWRAIASAILQVAVAAGLWALRQEWLGLLGSPLGMFG